MIIPTVRNSDELGITLDGLANQTYDDMEVVVVGPRDDKGKMEADSRGFRYIDDKGASNRADACNVAIEETESDLVFFTDDDVFVPEDWVERLERWFDRPDVAGVGGPNFAPVG